ncbi:MAG: hypothetical protein IKN17_07200 [Ruminococcus sp.]|nr:hypothetical protein [Ruminococcus sp.]
MQKYETHRYHHDVGAFVSAVLSAIKEYFTQHPEKSDLAWSVAGTEYLILSDIKYDGKTLYDIIADEKTDFNEADERIALYPVIEAMSEGQRALLSYVDIGEMIVNSKLDAEGWKNARAESEETLKSEDAVSVYTGVDRTNFQPAGVALTSEARKLESSTGSSYNTKLFGLDITTVMIASYASFAVVLVAGIATLKHGANLKSNMSNFLDVAKAHNKNLNDTASRFSEYLKKNNYEKLMDSIYEVEYPIDNVTKNQRSLFRKFFEEMDDNGDATVRMVVKGDDQVIERSIKDVFDDFTKDSEQNLKAYNSFNKTFQKVEDINKKNINAGIMGTKSRADYVRGKAWTKAGTVICIAAALLAVVSAVVTVYDIYKYYHQDYAPIPRKIVHESTDDKGRYGYIVYDVTKCNREAQGFGKDHLGDAGDMNGDVGKQWLALYTTKDKAAGDPITADIIAQKGSNKFPSDKGTSIRLFGQKDSLNIVSNDYGYNDKLGGLYIFSGTVKTDEDPAETPAEQTDPSAATADTSSETETVSEADTSSQAAAATDDTSSEASDKTTGSVVGTGTMVASCVGSAALGAMICFLIARKRKESAA